MIDIKNERIIILKKEILELLQTEPNKRFNYATVKQVFLNRGYCLEEFTKAFNGLVMENRIKGNDTEVWLFGKKLGRGF